MLRSCCYDGRRLKADPVLAGSRGAPLLVLGKLENSVPTPGVLLTLLAATPADFRLHLDGPSLPSSGTAGFLHILPYTGEQ